MHIPTRRVFPVIVVLLLVLAAVLTYRFCTSAVDEMELAGRWGNFKFFISALLDYCDKHKTFPPSVITNDGGQTKHSWRIALLPSVGYEKELANYHFDAPWDSPVNLLILPETPAEYQFGWGRQKSYLTNYLMVPGPTMVSRGPMGWKRGCRESSRDKVFILEVPKSDVLWMEPRDISVAEAVASVLKARGPTVYLSNDLQIHQIDVGTPRAQIEALFTYTGEELNGPADEFGASPETPNAAAAKRRQEAVPATGKRKSSHE